MTEFCEIKTPSAITEKQKSYRVKKTSDSGHTRVRPLGRGTKKEFILSWNILTSADKAILQTFFDDNHALDFIWTHPETNEEHTVYFVSDEIEYEDVAKGFWETSFEIGEV